MMFTLHSSTPAMSPTDQAAAAADAMYALAFDMSARERWHDASDVFRAMLLLCPTDERGWLGLGRCHDEMGQRAVAVELYTFSVLAVPQAVRTRVALARLLRILDRENDAEQILDTAEQIAESLADERLVQLVVNAKRES